jgi:NitT/TauT family transport system permease protein
MTTAAPIAVAGAVPRATLAWRALTGPGARAKLIAGLCLVLIWQFGVMAFAPPFVAKPLGVLAAIPSVIVDPEFLIAAQATLLAVLQGLVIALVAGTVVGIAMGRVKFLDRVLNPYINGFYTLPMVAALPLITIWIGYESNARLATVIFAAFFSIAMNARDGARSVPPEYLEVCKAYRAGARHVWFDITLFSSIPYLIAGARLAAGRALVGAVIAEFFVSLDGLGMYILTNAQGFQHDVAVVGVLALVLFGLFFESTMNWMLRRFFPWYRRDVEQGG